MTQFTVFHMDINSVLEKIGLSSSESKIYTALLEIGTASVQNLSKKAGVERTNTYAVLENLISKGLVREVSNNKKKIKKFVPEPPEKLMIMLREKEEMLNSVLPQLKSIYNLAPKKPKILFFEGREGIITIANRSLEKAKKEILFVSSTKHFHQITTEEYEDNYYIPTRIKNNISIRMIVVKNEWTLKKKQKDREEMRETRFFPEDFNLSASLFIYGSEVSFITSQQELLGVVIESKEIVELMKIFFETMWQASSKT